jgi:hypothetical protein
VISLLRRQHARDMKRLAADEISNLLAAGGAVGDQRIRVRLAHGRQQAGWACGIPLHACCRVSNVVTGYQWQLGVRLVQQLLLVCPPLHCGDCALTLLDFELMLVS